MPPATYTSQVSAAGCRDNGLNGLWVVDKQSFRKEEGILGRSYMQEGIKCVDGGWKFNMGSKFWRRVKVE